MDLSGEIFDSDVTFSSFIDILINLLAESPEHLTFLQP